MPPIPIGLFPKTPTVGDEVHQFLFSRPRLVSYYAYRYSEPMAPPPSSTSEPDRDDFALAAPHPPANPKPAAGPSTAAGPNAKPMPHVHLFTDGGCSGNPGPGGWAYILRDPRTGKEKEAFGSEPETTNNRMELLAVIRGLETLQRPCRVTLYADSQYVGNGLSSWMAGWKRNGWRRREGSKWAPVKNVELWQALDALLKRHQVTFSHVRGHAGHPENERCDQLAVAAYQHYL
jgi:ribonuclease HI